MNHLPNKPFPPTDFANGKIHMFIYRLIVGVIANVAIFGGLLFVPAGTFDWWRAWVFLGVVVVGTVATMLGVFANNEGLLDERLKPPFQRGQPLADKMVLVPLLASFFAAILFIPLDVFRFHLITQPSTMVSSLGLLLFIAGWWIISLSFKENAFAAPVVKHQEERGQTVVDTGVYSIVRHPMYTGTVLLLIGMPLWLESYAAALLASVPIGLLTVRILIEEQFLRRELKSYETYDVHGQSPVETDPVALVIAMMTPKQVLTEGSRSRRNQGTEMIIKIALTQT